MFKVLQLKKCEVVSNGVDYKRFYEINRTEAREYLKEDLGRKQVLFCSNPDRPEKNFKLAQEAINQIEAKDVDLKCLHDVHQDELVYHFNAADCLLLTSFHEGSPNVVKEAMACNVPVVATDVGDVNDVIGNTKGCFVSNFQVKDVADKIVSALNFKDRTSGRKDIEHLEESVVAKKIINIYNKTLES